MHVPHCLLHASHYRLGKHKAMVLKVNVLRLFDRPLLAVIEFPVGTTMSVQSSMVSDLVGQPSYYWVVLLIVAIIQAEAFPLGASLIAAGVPLVSFRW